MEFKDYFVMALVIGLFVFCMFAFSIGLSSENNAQVNLNQNPVVNKMFGNISSELNKSSANADIARAGLIEEEKNPIITTLGFVFKSILAAGNTFMSMGISMITYIFTFVQETLNISPIITGTLLAILIGLLVLAIWSVIRAGR